MELPKTPAELKARYPYQFGGPNIGISFIRGWFPMFVRLCADIDAALGADKHEFHWTQVKEKFGSGRFYYSLTGKADLRIDVFSQVGVQSLRSVKKPVKQRETSTNERLLSLIDAAENWTRTHCIVCGQPAALDRSQHYLMVLCPDHLRARQNDTLGPVSIWMEEDDES